MSQSFAGTFMFLKIYRYEITNHSRILENVQEF